MRRPTYVLALSLLVVGCDSSEDLVLDTIVANAGGDHQTACTRGVEALEQRGTANEAEHFLTAAAESCLRSGNTTGADRVIARATELDPTAAWPIALRAELAPDGAEAVPLGEFRSVLERDPNNVDANHGIAVSLVSAGAFAEALPHARVAAAYSRNQPEVRATYALALAGADQPEDAIEQLQLIADQEYPAEARAAAFGAVGEAFQRARQYPAAKEHYRRALTFDPHNALSVKNLGALLLNEERWDDVIALLEPTLDAIDDPSIPALLSLAFSGAGFPGDAERAARRASDAGHRNLSGIWRKVSEAYAAAGLPADAARVLEFGERP